MRGANSATGYLRGTGGRLLFLGKGERRCPTPPSPTAHERFRESRREDQAMRAGLWAQHAKTRRRAACQPPPLLLAPRTRGPAHEPRRVAVAAPRRARPPPKTADPVAVGRTLLTI